MMDDERSFDEERTTDDERRIDSQRKLDRSGAYAFDLLDEDREAPPEEFSNPPGIGRGSCDDEQASAQDASCAIESTAEIDDLVLEETKPGFGIPGFEGEEDGGG